MVVEPFFRRVVEVADGVDRKRWEHGFRMQKHVLEVQEKAVQRAERVVDEKREAERLEHGKLQL